ncbi:MAG TPA: NAD(P)-dependent oxidoreductase [Gaiellaceae bacterium]|jgi:nucleoside-diphosphate-sugar epimerase
MTRVAITGAAGTIGSVLMGGLTGHELTALDLPGCDLRDADLTRAFRRQSVVVHLAWSTQIDNAFSKAFDPDNSLMTFRVLEAAVAACVGRVVLASSVHADRYKTWEGPGTLKPNALPLPDSPYGAGKVFMESLGRYFASHRGLEVVCIRFGGVNPLDAEPADASDCDVWLRHPDCVALVRRCVEIDAVPGRFAVLYGVSEHGSPPRVDVENSLGWRPLPL